MLTSLVALILVAILILSMPMVTTTIVYGQQLQRQQQQSGTTNTSPSGIELSPQPVYREWVAIVSETPINQTHISATYSGNGTLTLPNSSQTINTTSNGSSLFSSMEESEFVQGMETIRTTEEEEGDGGGETATARFEEIVKLSPATNQYKGIIIAVIDTNSTGMLAPLDGMIVVGIDDIQPDGDNHILTFWE